MVSIKELHWLAGIMEGEACFGLRGTGKSYTYPVVELYMTDKDVVDRAISVLEKAGVKVKAGTRSFAKYNPKWKLQHAFKLYGTNAVQCMMTLYPLLGIRRQEACAKAISGWKSSKGRDWNKRVDGLCRRGHDVTGLDGYTPPNGRLQCRKCKNLNKQKHHLEVLGITPDGKRA